jgi:oligoribonuclease
MRAGAQCCAFYCCVCVSVRKISTHIQTNQMTFRAAEAGHKLYCSALPQHYGNFSPYSSNYSAVWVWIDIETSGLDPHAQNFGILEIAAVVTDNDMQHIAELHLIIHHDEHIFSSASAWCKQHFASRLQGGNGLFDLCRSSTIDQVSAGVQLQEFIRKHATPRQRYKLDNTTDGNPQDSIYRVMLAGSSVYFDRQVLLAIYPTLIHYINHKVIDVTSLLETIRRFKPSALRFLQPVKNSHRAMVDILESIALMRWYFRVLMQST